MIACDVAERAQVAGLLTRAEGSGPALAAIMHAAGRGQATSVDDTTIGELAGIVAAKAAGAAHLDELTAELGLDLERFVLFSSVSATWGSGLPPAYAAANAFLDALAQARRDRGLPGTSVAWGPWGGGGMTDQGSGEQMRRRGLRLMAPGLAIGALAGVLDGDESLITVADVDWARFAPPFTMRRPSPLVAHLPEVRQALGTDDDLLAVRAGTGRGRTARADRDHEQPARMADPRVRGPHSNAGWQVCHVPRSCGHWLTWCGRKWLPCSAMPRPRRSRRVGRSATSVSIH